MHSTKKRFPTFWVLFIIVTTVILVCLILFWQNQNRFIRSIPRSLEVEILGPTQPTDDASVTTNYGNPSTWPYFNRNFDEIPNRSFRFRYPALFMIDNIDSGPVALNKNEEYYLTVEEVVPLTDFYLGNNPDEQFKAYYFYRKSENYRNHPNFVFKRIDVRDNVLLYKVANHTNHYLGEINGRGIEVVDSKKLPEDIVVNIIRSIEFR